MLPPTDFDGWRRLAADDPDQFERMRRLAIEAAIARASLGRHARLRALQWRIDVARTRAANPLAGCVVVSRMMWARVAGPGGLAEALRKGTATGRIKAQIIRFPDGT